MPLTHYLYLAMILFVIGLAGALLRRSLVAVLGSVQVMLAAVVLLVCAYAREHGEEGYVLGLLIAVVGLLELAVAVAVVVRTRTSGQAIGDLLADWTAIGDEEQGG